MMPVRTALCDLELTTTANVPRPYADAEGMTSWEFFDKLLEEVNIVGTPGSGFGPHGEGYFRLTAFGTKENTIKAIERIKSWNK